MAVLLRISRYAVPLDVELIKAVVLASQTGKHDGFTSFILSRFLVVIYASGNGKGFKRRHKVFVSVILRLLLRLHGHGLLVDEI